MSGRIAQFDYANAVADDVCDWMDENITEWGNLPTVEEWKAAFADDTSLKCFVCGDIWDEYHGNHPASYEEMMEGTCESYEYVMEQIPEPDEAMEIIKEYGLMVFDTCARMYYFKHYVQSDDFATEIKKRLDMYWEQKLALERAKLEFKYVQQIRETRTNYDAMCLMKQFVCEYDALVRNKGNAEFLDNGNENECKKKSCVDCRECFN